MDIEQLKLSLQPWLALETWHTGHALDEQRFHKALKSAFKKLGTPIAVDHFRDAIILGLAEYRASDVKNFENDVDSFAQLGEDISYYVANTSK
ncbi:hypothetical protein PFAS1_23555 [Pseudomonas frederiksbergensis]|jgi:hypothetical protein|uniref:hypothetical protein n=1 Tax=Pseudomonas frederiksbergensis TaxID=104087 RepID=UPI00095876F8|nr:hypothetical protein [Pseudomonas frederiksbergensis]APV42150.1 hypothetical protein PFAS1_23555 [Pseudomonas frederiksbergensis]